MIEKEVIQRENVQNNLNAKFHPILKIFCIIDLWKEISWIERSS